MRDIFEEHLCEEIIIKSYYLGRFRLSGAYDNYFAILLRGNRERYIPYSAILEVEEATYEGISLVVKLVGFDTEFIFRSE